MAPAGDVKQRKRRPRWATTQPSTRIAAVVYALAGSAQRAIAFLLIPLYTQVLSPSEYGELSVMLSIAALASIVFAFGVDYSIFRSYFEHEHQPARQRVLVNSVWRFLTATSLAIALVAGLVVWLVVGRDGRHTGPDVLIALVAAALSVSSTALPAALLRAAQRLRDYLVMTAVSTAATVGITLFFVVALDGGVTGWLLAMAAANAVTLVGAALLVPWERTAYDWPLVRATLVLGLPMVPHFASHWALQLADRAIVALLVSAASLGAYSLGANFGVPVLVAAQATNLALMPTYARAGSGAVSLTALRSVMTRQAAAVIALTVGGALLAVPLITLLVPDSYAGAESVAPWIALGYGLLGLYFIPMNNLTLVAGVNRHVWILSALSALANIALVYVLVPEWGIEGAGVASALGYLTLLCTVLVYALRSAPQVRYSWLRLAALVATGGAVYALAVATTGDTGLGSLVGRTAWTVIAALLLLALAEGAGISQLLRRRLARRA